MREPRRASRTEGRTRLFGVLAAALLCATLAPPTQARAQEASRYEGKVPAEGNRAIWIVDRDTGHVRFCIGEGGVGVTADCSPWTAEGTSQPRPSPGPGSVQAAPQGRRYRGEIPSEGNRAIWVLDEETGLVRFCIGANGNGVKVECSRWMAGG